MEDGPHSRAPGRGPKAARPAINVRDADKKRRLTDVNVRDTGPKVARLAINVRDADKKRRLADVKVRDTDQKRRAWPLRSATRTRSGASRTDRKSTRLNSSHGYISYAVFCLKKKK